jgi:hypothetical protein
MTTRPDKSKEQLIADERSAEAAVVRAEYEVRAAEVAGARGVDLLEYEAYVDNARRDSLRIRQDMTEGLAQWHQWDSEQELARTAKELGIVA